MGNKKNLVRLFIVYVLMYSSCTSNPDESEDLFRLEVTNVDIETKYNYNKSDSNKLVPDELFMSINVINDSDDTASFGSYNNQYDQKNKNYGIFQLIFSTDTIDLFSRASAYFNIPPHDTLEVQTSYRGDELDRFIIELPDTEYKGIKKIHDQLKLRFYPIPIKGERPNYPMINKAVENIKSDIYVIQYKNHEGNALLSAVKQGDKYFALPQQE